MMREEERKALIETFQSVMKEVRMELGWTAAQLAAMLGVSRQTVSNLETRRQPMAWVQYLSLAALVDYAVEGKDAKRQKVLKALDEAGANNMWYTPAAQDGSLLLRALTGVVQETADPAQAKLYTRLAEKTKIFLDADIFLAEGAVGFFATFSGYLQQGGTRAILPYRAVQQLDQDGSPEARTRAMAIARNLQKDGCLVIRGEQNDPDTHDTIRSVFLKFRSRYALTLLTQDEAFAQDVLRMNADTSRGRGLPIEVYRLAGGVLRPYELAPIDWLNPKQEPLDSWDDLSLDDDTLAPDERPASAASVRAAAALHYVLAEEEQRPPARRTPRAEEADLLKKWFAVG